MPLVARWVQAFLGGFDTDHQVTLFDFESNWDTLHGGAYGAFGVHVKYDFVLDTT